MQILLTLFISSLFAIDIESIPYFFGGDDQNGLYKDEKRNDILDSSESHNSNVRADYEKWEVDYPEKHISNLLKTFPSIAEISNNSLDFMNFIDDEFEINDMDLCKSLSKSAIFPRTYKNINGVQRIIVNQDGVEQKISETMCMDKGGKCSDAEKLNMSSKCEQNFSRIRLLIFNKGIMKLEWDHFDIPCGCICVWEKIENNFLKIYN